MRRHAPGDDVRGGVEIGAAMMVNNTLRVAGGARGVVERNGVPFVGRPLPGEVRVTCGENGFVLDAADTIARPGIFRIVDIDHQQLAPCLRQRSSDGRRKFAVRDQDLRLAMVEHEGNGFGIQAGIQRVEHGTGHGHAEMAFEHFRRVGEHRRNGVALADAIRLQGRGQSPAAGIGLGPGEAARAMNGGNALRIDSSRPLDERKGRQGRVVGRVLLEADRIGICRHMLTPEYSGCRPVGRRSSYGSAERYSISMRQPGQVRPASRVIPWRTLRLLRSALPRRCLHPHWRPDGTG